MQVEGDTPLDYGPSVLSVRLGDDGACLEAVTVQRQDESLHLRASGSALVGEHELDTGSQPVRCAFEQAASN